MGVYESRRDYMRNYQRKWVANRRAEFFKDKFCVKCGSTERLELDHINPETKVTSSIWSWSIAKRNEELVKCQILCHDCHLEKSIAYDWPTAKCGTESGYRKHSKNNETACEECKKASREARQRQRKNAKNNK